MAYIRPQPKQRISKEERKQLLQEYYLHYKELIHDQGIEALRGCPACFLILKGVVISSHETDRFS